MGFSILWTFLGGSVTPPPTGSKSDVNGSLDSENALFLTSPENSRISRFENLEVDEFIPEFAVYQNPILYHQTETTSTETTST